MRRKHPVLVAAVMILGALACLTATACRSAATSSPAPATAPSVARPSTEATESTQAVLRVRIFNSGKTALGDVTVWFPSDTVHFGDVAVGGSSDYRAVASAYGYARVQATVDGSRRDIRPVDYVGESLLRPGDYTYAVQWAPDGTGNDGFKLELQRD